VGEKNNRKIRTQHIEYYQHLKKYERINGFKKVSAIPDKVCTKAKPHLR
jgi:hypothetical protein